jgi:hypothetical protein
MVISRTFSITEGLSMIKRPRSRIRASARYPYGQDQREDELMLWLNKSIDYKILVNIRLSTIPDDQIAGSTVDNSTLPGNALDQFRRQPIRLLYGILN